MTSALRGTGAVGRFIFVYISTCGTSDSACRVADGGLCHFSCTFQCAILAPARDTATTGRVTFLCTFQRAIVEAPRGAESLYGNSACLLVS